MTFYFFFFNDTATTEIYTLSLHDALPISRRSLRPENPSDVCLVSIVYFPGAGPREIDEDRKSTRLNSSHDQISYAVFCLKKKKDNTHILSTSCDLLQLHSIINSIYITTVS